MMTDAMKYWANLVKEEGKKIIISMIKRAVGNFILEKLEILMKKVMKEIYIICERRGYDPNKVIFAR